MFHFCRMIQTALIANAVQEERDAIGYSDYSRIRNLQKFGKLYSRSCWAPLQCQQYMRGWEPWYILKGTEIKMSFPKMPQYSNLDHSQLTSQPTHWARGGSRLPIHCSLTCTACICSIALWAFSLCNATCHTRLAKLICDQPTNCIYQACSWQGEVIAQCHSKGTRELVRCHDERMKIIAVVPSPTSNPRFQMLSPQDQQKAPSCIRKPGEVSN